MRGILALIAVFLSCLCFGQADLGPVVGWGFSAMTQSASSNAPIVQISNGVALRADGTVVCWTNNGYTKYAFTNYGADRVPNGLSGVVQVSGGGSHCLALKADGTVVAWGLNKFGEADVPKGLSGVVQIAAGEFHSLALKSDGTVVAWGNNSDGETDVPKWLTGIVQITGGSVALKSDGTLVAWGKASSDYGSFLATLKGIVRLDFEEKQIGNALGDLRTVGLALKKDGTVVSWGDNTFGQTDVPKALTGVTQISVGNVYCLALKSDSTVVEWGVGNVVPEGLHGVVQIAAQGDFSYGNMMALALKTDGTIASWGNTDPTFPSLHNNLTSVVQIAGDVDHCLGLNADGTVFGWGENTFGDIPKGLSNVVQIACGGSHCLALKADGTLVAWGGNSYGECNVPKGLSKIVQIAAGYYFSIALKSDGTVVAWGNDDRHQIDIPAKLNNVIQIASREDHTVALKMDGTVVAWGDNFYAQSNVPTGLSGVVQVATSGKHDLALKADGTVVAWGHNEDYGECNVPQGLRDVVQVAAGEHHSLALKKGGTVVAWGGGIEFDLPVPQNLIGIVQISALGHSLFALAGMSISTDVATANSETGGTGHLTVFMPVTSKTPTSVTVTTDDPALDLPGAVTVPSGSHSVTIPVTIHKGIANGTHFIKATLGALTQYAAISAAPLRPALALATASVIGGSSVSATVSTNFPAPVGGYTALLSSGDAAVKVPAYVLIPAGQYSATFTVSSAIVSTNKSVKITAVVNKKPVTTNLSVLQRPYTLAISTKSVVGGTAATGTLTLPQPAISPGLTIALASDNATVAVPATVTVATGASSASFPISTVPVANSVTANISTTIGSYTTSGTVTVTPPSLRSLQFSPVTLKGGKATTGTVTLTGPAPTGGVVIALSSSDPVAALPATVTIPAKATSATFTVTTGKVTSTKKASINAKFGNTLSVTLIISP